MKKKFHPDMTIHTPIESIRNMLFLNIKVVIPSPEIAKTGVGLRIFKGRLKIKKSNFSIDKANFPQLFLFANEQIKNTFG